MSLFGAFPSEGTILFRVSSDHDVPRSVKIVIHSDGLQGDGEVHSEYDLTTNDGRVFELSLSVSAIISISPSSLFYYRYDVLLDDRMISLGGEAPTDLLPHDEYGDRQLLFYDPDFRTADFIKGGGIYHIFVDRFASSGKYSPKQGAKINPDWDNGIPEYAEYRGAHIKNNEFFGGDLTGACEKLDYISSLGVNCIYLSPVFDSPSNHKYDTSDYMTVDPMFGGDGALAHFIKECDRRGIHVILDGVFNHTGDDSIYFDKYGNYGGHGAYCDKDSPYFRWFNFRKYPDDYECWWNIVILPRVNTDDRSFREYILGKDGVVEKYFGMGISGFRLDVADELSEPFISALRQKIGTLSDDPYLIGEVWEDASNKISYSERRHYLCGKELDSVMNYPLRDGVISFIKNGDSETLKYVLETVYRHYPKCVSDTLMNFLSTHDTERIITTLAGECGDDKTPRELSILKIPSDKMPLARRLVKCAWSVISTTYGVPSIFYGDEAGVQGYHDPFCRMPFPWGREDPYLLDFYKRIGGFRRGESLFKEGFFSVVSASPNEIVTSRFDDSSSLYTVVTRDKPFVFKCPVQVKCVFDSEGDISCDNDSFTVPPFTARIYKSV